MLGRKGVTLMEIIVVIIIIGIAATFMAGNFFVPTEQAKATSVQNNLLAIYSAQRNYNNNYGTYCLNTSNSAQPACTGISPNSSCATNLAQINCNLSLNIQDDGSYTYQCTNASGFTCTATRATKPTFYLTVTNAPTSVNGGATGNPACPGAGGVAPAGWCP